MEEYKVGKILKTAGIVLGIITLLTRHIMFLVLKETGFFVAPESASFWDKMMVLYYTGGHTFFFELSLISICGISFGLLLFGLGTLIQMKSKT